MLIKGVNVEIYCIPDPRPLEHIIQRVEASNTEDTNYSSAYVHLFSALEPRYGTVLTNSASTENKKKKTREIWAALRRHQSTSISHEED